MANPRADLFNLCNITDTVFWPLNRQELSRTAGGNTQAKDLGPPLWQASFTTAPAEFSEAAKIEAALISLGGSIGSFLAHDVRRPYPAAHPGGYVGALTIAALSSTDGYVLKIKAAAGGLRLRLGDYLGFSYGPRPSRALHMVQQEVSILTAGQEKYVKVWPAIAPGAAVGAAVTVNRAPCEMILEPGGQPPSIRDFVASSVSFSAVQIF